MVFVKIVVVTQAIIFDYLAVNKSLNVRIAKPLIVPTTSDVTKLVTIIVAKLQAFFIEADRKQGSHASF